MNLLRFKNRKAKRFRANSSLPPPNVVWNFQNLIDSLFVICCKREIPVGDSEDSSRDGPYKKLSTKERLSKPIEITTDLELSWKDSVSVRVSSAWFLNTLALKQQNTFFY